MGAAVFGLVFSLVLASLGSFGTPPAVQQMAPGDSSRAGGTGDSIAAVGVVPPGAQAPDASGLASADGEWTFCSNLGEICRFTGLREVRLISVSGAAVTQTAYGSVNCTVAGFQNRNPAPLSTMRCDYGPMKVEILSNPNSGTWSMGATVSVAMGSPGVSAQQVRPTTVATVATDGAGAFRTTCQPTGFRFRDPLGGAGRSSGAPLRVFFGNAGADQNATPASIATRGSSSCLGGTLDRSLYYAPAVIDARTGEVQVPDDAVLTFKTGVNMDPATIRPMPAGLVIIAGERDATGRQLRAAEWRCRDRYIENAGVIPDCPVGDQVQLWIHFPQCWDGRNLDASDHKQIGRAHV